MKAFEIFINGHRLCLAGIGDDGVLSATVNWVGNPQGEEDFFLTVGGLDCAADEHLRWNVPSLGLGSEVLIRVVEASSVDPPDAARSLREAAAPGAIPRILPGIQRRIDS